MLVLYWWGWGGEDGEGQSAAAVRWRRLVMEIETMRFSGMGAIAVWCIASTDSAVLLQHSSSLSVDGWLGLGACTIYVFSSLSSSCLSGLIYSSTSVLGARERESQVGVVACSSALLLIQQRHTTGLTRRCSMAQRRWCTGKRTGEEACGAANNAGQRRPIGLVIGRSKEAT